MSALRIGRLLALPAWLSLALLVVLSTGAAAGPCEGPILTQFNFDTLPAMWQTPANNPSVSNGQLVMQPSQNGLSRVSLDLGGGHDIEACIFSVFAAGHGGQAGLSVFTAGTEILFAIDDAGRAVVRKNGGDTNGWVDLVPPRADPAIAPKFEFNQLTVKINGSNATFLVNDVELAAVKGAIPDGPLTLSIDATSDAEAVSTWRFDELTVTVDPVIAAIAQTSGGPPGLLDALVEDVPGCPGVAILADDFTAQPSGSLAADPAVAVVNGKLDMKLAANADHFVPWPVAGGREVNACASVALVDGAGSDASLNISGADGAVLFDVDPQHGVAGIYFRDAANTVSSLVKKRWMPALRRGPAAENKLHVRIMGDRAIFYVNGAKFDSVEGKLPKGPLNVELEGLAGQGGATWAFDDLKVTPLKPIEVAAVPSTSTQAPANTTSAPPLASVPTNPAPTAAQSSTEPPAGGTSAPAPAPAPAATQPAASQSGGAAVAAASAGPTRCQGPVLMQSSFDSLPAIWATPYGNKSVHGGKLIVRKGTYRDRLDLGGRHDFETCVTVAFNGDSSDTGEAGIYVAANEFSEILFTINNKGQAVISKYAGGWTDLVAPQANPAIKPIGEDNRLAVTISGADATFWINGVEIASVTGVVPDGPLTLGFYAPSSRWLFDDLVVAAPENPGSAASPEDVALFTAGCAGEPIAQDSFDAPLPNTIDDPKVSVADGKLTMKVYTDKASYLAWGLQDVETSMRA